MDNKKILIIDDEITLQKTLSEVLAQEGFLPSSALDGEKGLELAINLIPSLILLDIIMPRLDGFKVLEELKKNAETKDIPIIILTNLEGEAEAKKMLRMGAVDYLIKSNYSLDDLINKIKTQIAK